MLNVCVSRNVLSLEEEIFVLISEIVSTFSTGTDLEKCSHLFPAWLTNFQISLVQDGVIYSSRKCPKENS